MPIKLLWHCLRSPTMIGSIAPSSPSLAKAMCLPIVGDNPSCIVELGAGTGPITQALHRRYPNVPLTIIERDEVLASALRHRFHGAHVIASCIHEIPEFFATLPSATLLVSSLPFRSLPPVVKQPTVRLLVDFLQTRPSARLLQYTYRWGVPFAVPPFLRWHRHRTVLANLPPAHVWELGLK